MHLRRGQEDESAIESRNLAMLASDMAYIIPVCIMQRIVAVVME
jgi:hypothetical protein